MFDDEEMEKLNESDYDDVVKRAEGVKNTICGLAVGLGAGIGLGTLLHWVMGLLSNKNGNDK